MYKKDIGKNIARLRKEKNMTQIQLGDLMNVTDKAVSKWERSLSYPDIDTLPKLADVLGVEVEELVGFRADKNEESKFFKEDFNKVISIVFKALPLPMGVAVVILSILKKLDISSGFIMLGIGMFLMALDRLKNS